MADAAPARSWGGQLSWLSLSALVIFLQLLPLDTVPRTWAGPDFLLAVTLVWVARRPEYVPAPMVAAVFLLADLLFQRPPGLGAGLVLILTEMVRGRAAGLRQLPFPFEWMTIGAGVIAIALLQYLVMALTLTPQATLGLVMMEAFATALAYPLIVILAYLVFGVSRPAPGEVDSLGRRL